MASGFDGINLNRLVIFSAVVESGSITQAAYRLKLGKTVVSTHIRELERELGATLLARNTRSLGLTEAGKLFFESVQKILGDTRAAVDLLSENYGQPRGVLRITAPVDYSNYVLMPVLVKLREKFPELVIELVNDDSCIDLIGNEVDVGIRLSELSDSNLQAVQIGSFTLYLVAAPEFLSAFPALSHPRELDQLPHIVFSVFSPFNLVFSHRHEPSYRIRFKPGISVNSAFMAKAAALAGGGLAVVPDFAATEDIRCGRLVRVLPEWFTENKGIHVVFPNTPYLPNKVRVLIDHLKLSGNT